MPQVILIVCGSLILYAKTEVHTPCIILYATKVGFVSFASVRHTINEKQTTNKHVDKNCLK